MGKLGYTYDKCQVTNVVDGDTIDVCIDLGFHCLVGQRLRLQDFDTPEYFGPKCAGERDFALVAMTFVKNELLGKVVSITTNKTDKYGRYVAVIRYFRNGSDVPVSLADVLAENNFSTDQLDCLKCKHSDGCTKPHRVYPPVVGFEKTSA